LSTISAIIESQQRKAPMLSILKTESPKKEKKANLNNLSEFRKENDYG
jgi:hypothetical protein